ncbi:carbohydrate-binding module family 50 protein [Auriscalpium vulgare]|uniref:Carbohydrate-binding module family 50 protein n=1 Tax=Auriscalpium vulgare TaxID=40419 RepID=A0ACB8S5K1_9AGAM|nr:carbohydrate-binding module family 50 protein [Auriscalpium vulgare]
MFAAKKLNTLVTLLAVCFGGASAQDSCARTYIVSSGDTCDKISASQNVSTFQLATVNEAIIDTACDNLAIGEVLCLGITGQDCSDVHIVASGDSCDLVSEAAGIPLSTLLINNPNVNSDCTSIDVGEVLCTSSTIFVNGTSS